jgi:hypothetical protein
MKDFFTLVTCIIFLQVLLSNSLDYVRAFVPVVTECCSLLSIHSSCVMLSHKVTLSECLWVVLI